MTPLVWKESTIYLAIRQQIFLCLLFKMGKRAKPSLLYEESPIFTQICAPSKPTPLKLRTNKKE